MAPTKEVSAQNIRLHPKREGFLIDDRFVEGFPDMPELSEEARLKVARWAQRLRPSEVTAAQRRLLEGLASAKAARRASEELSGYSRNLVDLRTLYDQGLHGALSEDQRRLLANPSSHPRLEGRSYPLTVGDLHVLTGASERQLRHWADQGLLPSHRISNRRSFYSGALARAFLLAESDQFEKSTVKALTQGGEQATRVARLVASALLASVPDMPVHVRHEVATAAETLLRHSQALGQRADDVKNEPVEEMVKWLEATVGVRLTAFATGARQTAIRRIAAGELEAEAELEQRLRNLYAVARFLSVRDRPLPEWLEEPNPKPHGRSPGELLREGKSPQPAWFGMGGHAHEPAADK